MLFRSGTPPEPKPTDPEVFKRPEDEAGKRALAAERARAKAAEEQAADLKKRLDELDDKDKSEVEKLRKENADLKTQISDRDGRLLRAEVAAAKGLTPAQAKRLVGATQAELEADADEILEAFGGPKKPDDPAKDDKNGPPSNRPKPNLGGGSDPTATGQESEEMNPRKLAESIPRA